MSDLAELLVQDAEAWHAWLDSHHADHLGVWLVLHKRPATRDRKLAEYVDMLARGESIHPRKPRKDRQ